MRKWDKQERGMVTVRFWLTSLWANVQTKKSATHAALAQAIQRGVGSSNYSTIDSQRYFLRGKLCRADDSAGRRFKQGLLLSLYLATATAEDISLGSASYSQATKRPWVEINCWLTDRCPFSLSPGKKSGQLTGRYCKGAPMLIGSKRYYVIYNQNRKRLHHFLASSTYFKLTQHPTAVGPSDRVGAIQRTLELLNIPWESS